MDVDAKLAVLTMALKEDDVVVEGLMATLVADSNPVVAGGMQQSTTRRNPSLPCHTTKRNRLHGHRQASPEDEQLSLTSPH